MPYVGFPTVGLSGLDIRSACQVAEDVMVGLLKNEKHSSG